VSDEIYQASVGRRILSAVFRLLPPANTPGFQFADVTRKLALISTTTGGATAASFPPKLWLPAAPSRLRRRRLARHSLVTPWTGPAQTPALHTQALSQQSQRLLPDAPSRRLDLELYGMGVAVATTTTRLPRYFHSASARVASSQPGKGAFTDVTQKPVYSTAGL